DITSKEGFELEQEWTIANNSPLEGDFIPETETTTTSRIDSISEETTGNYRDADDGFGSFTAEGTDIRDEVQTLTREPSRFENLSRDPFVAGHFDRVTGGSVRFSVLNDTLAVDFVLSMLHQQIEAKLLANPRVLVLDNETADFEVVREIPYREMMQVERAAAVTFTDFKNVGVDLKVTPHVARDGMIRLQIEPQFGILVGSNENGAPIVDARRSKTVAMIKDGQTIAMSGLRQRSISKDVSRVPIFSDLPLVGGLFNSETESEQVQDLVVFITTRIITEAGLTELERRQFQATDLGPVGMSQMRLDSPYFKKPIKETDIKSELDELIKKLEEGY
ncbi:MAG: type II and III secretion system protein, partial [Planctomycetota bacterium]